MKRVLQTLVQPKYRIPLATALGFGIGALYYKYKQRADKSILLDLVVPGASMAVGFNVIGWLMTDMGVFPMLVAKTNSSHEEGMGQLSSEAVKFLSNINPELYDSFKGMGLKIAPIPSNPSIIVQDEE
jgi:hypothetical protein